MPTYEVDWSDGHTYEVDGPEGMTDEQVAAAVAQELMPKPQAGFVQSFKEAAAGLTSGLDAGKFAADTTPESRQALIESQKSKFSQTGFSDIENLTDAWNWAKQTAGGSMGYLAAPGAAALGAELLSKAPGASKLAGLGVLGAQYATQHLGRQAQTQQQAIDEGRTPDETNVPAALLTAAGSTALDALGFEFFSPVFKKFPIVGKLFGTEGSEAAKLSAKDLIKAAEDGTLQSRRAGFVQGIARGVAFEIPQEIAQQALERAQAGLSLTDEDARREYIEAGAGAVLLGSTLGGLHGGVIAHDTKFRAAQLVHMKQAEDAKRAEEAKTAAEAAQTKKDEEANALKAAQAATLKEEAAKNKAAKPEMEFDENGIPTRFKTPTGKEPVARVPVANIDPEKLKQQTFTVGDKKVATLQELLSDDKINTPNGIDLTAIVEAHGLELRGNRAKVGTQTDFLIRDLKAAGVLDPEGTTKPGRGSTKNRVYFPINPDLAEGGLNEKLGLKQKLEPVIRAATPEEQLQQDTAKIAAAQQDPAVAALAAAEKLRQEEADRVNLERENEAKAEAAARAQAQAYAAAAAAEKEAANATPTDANRSAEPAGRDLTTGSGERDGVLVQEPRTEGRDAAVVGNEGVDGNKQPSAAPDTRAKDGPVTLGPDAALVDYVREHINRLPPEDNRPIVKRIVKALNENPELLAKREGKFVTPLMISAVMPHLHKTDLVRKSPSGHWLTMKSADVVRTRARNIAPEVAPETRAGETFEGLFNRLENLAQRVVSKKDTKRIEQLISGLKKKRVTKEFAEGALQEVKEAEERLGAQDAEILRNDDIRKASLHESEAQRLAAINAEREANKPAFVVEERKKTPDEITREQLMSLLRAGKINDALRHAKDYFKDNPISTELLERLAGIDFSKSKVVVNDSLATYEKHKAVFQTMSHRKHLAEYSPRTNTFYFTQHAASAPKIFVHEVVHSVTVRAIYAYKNNPESLSKQQREAVQHLEKLYEFANQRFKDQTWYRQIVDRRLKTEGITSYVTGRAEDENLYEFVANVMSEPRLQRELAKMQAPSIAKYTKSVKNLWKQFVDAVAKLFGLTDTKGNVLAETTAAISQILQAPDESIDLAPLPKRHPRRRSERIEQPIMSPEEAGRKFGQNNLGVTDKPAGVRSLASFYFSNKGLNWLATKFQNDRRALLVLENMLIGIGKLVTEGPNINNLNTLITLSTGLAKYYLNTHLLQNITAANREIAEFAKANGIEIKEALGRLHLYTMAEHEAERRKTKYLLNVPLRNGYADRMSAQSVGLDKWFGQVQQTPAGFREIMLRDLSNDTDAVSDGRAKAFRGVMEQLASQYASNDASSATTTGTQPTKLSLDPLHRDYDVVGEYSHEQFELWRKALPNDKGYANYKRLVKILDEIKDATIVLNKKANFWSQQTDNFKEFYGWQKYVPFKGKPNVSEEDERFDFTSKRFGSDLTETTQTFEGRQSDPDNPVLQIMLEATKSASRAGRKNVTLAIRNLIDPPEGADPLTKRIAGKIEAKKYTFYDRYKGYYDANEMKGPNKVLHYKSDGSIEIFSIKDPEMRDAIRRGYTDPQPIIQALNKITSGIGHMHTRYNPAFHPYNYVRDMLTNAFAIGAEKGWHVGGGLISTVARQVTDGGLVKAGRITRLFNTGNMAELDRLYREGDAHEKAMIEFIREGGEVTYVQGLSLKGRFDGVIREIGPSRFVQTKDQIDKYVDIWSGMFELSSRAATYALMRSNGMSKQEAAAYAKNMMNFEQVGEWGRAAGAVFMFFRPAATGAMRAIDAMRPAFENVDNLIADLPEDIRNNEVAVHEFRTKHMEAKQNAQTMLYGLAGAGLTMYMMAYLAADEDEVGRNKVSTDDMALWSRNARLPLGFMGYKGYLQIPWGFGLGSFAAAGAQVGGLAFGSARPVDAASNLINIALDSFVPIPVSRIDPIANPGAWFIDSLIPTAVRPIVEFQMNTDSLGREIYNDRSNKYGDAYTGGANIPPAYMAASRYLSEITNTELTVQPDTMNFWINNYVDGVARIAHTAYGLGLWAEGNKGFDPKTDIPGLSSYIGKESNYDGKRYSLIENRMEDIKSKLDMITNDPEQLAEYTRRRPNDAMMVEIYEKYTNRGLRNLRHQKNVIVATHNGEMLPVGTYMPDGTVLEEPVPYNDKLRKEFLEENKLMQNRVKRSLIDKFAQYGMEP